MSSVTELDWKRRLPDDPDSMRQIWRLVAILVAGLLVWCLLTWLNETWNSRILRILLNVVVPFIVYLPAFWTKEKDILANRLKILEPLKEHLEDFPVSVCYRYRGVELGHDAGFIGRRRDGFSFSGEQTAFLIASDLVIKVAEGSDNVRELHISNPKEEGYELTVRPIGSYDLNKNDIVALKMLFMSDGENAPPSTIHKGLPKVASPYVRSGAYFHPKLFLVTAILIPLLMIGGYIWWAINLSDEVGKTVFVGVLLFLLLLALLVVGVRDFWKPISQTRQSVAELDARAQAKLGSQ